MPCLCLSVVFTQGSGRVTGEQAEKGEFSVGFVSAEMDQDQGKYHKREGCHLKDLGRDGPVSYTHLTLPTKA